jgi:hypothetical protein
MSKVGDDEDDVLYRGSWLTVRAMRRRNGELPAKGWFDGLDKVGMGRFLARVGNVEVSWASGRPPGDAVGKVEASKCGLWELRVTPKGSTPPHHRALYLRRDNTMWIASGFTKTSNKLKTSDIDRGDAIAAEWLDNDGKTEL